MGLYAWCGQLEIRKLRHWLDHQVFFFFHTKEAMQREQDTILSCCGQRSEILNVGDAISPPLHPIRMIVWPSLNGAGSHSFGAATVLIEEGSSASSGQSQVWIQAKIWIWIGEQVRTGPHAVSHGHSVCERNLRQMFVILSNYSWYSQTPATLYSPRPTTLF